MIKEVEMSSQHQYVTTNNDLNIHGAFYGAYGYPIGPSARIRFIDLYDQTGRRNVFLSHTILPKTPTTSPLRKPLLNFLLTNFPSPISAVICDYQSAKSCLLRYQE
ncbi:hypothetical protein RF11_11028 [Thelohanellus kitauei]|uniref:Uncharacterized protein n=1 Tax=Thelohanellus kitauei TaxID=669202 RepID=A0A0C2MDJ8_THEKT|nr:hypothetical protein RF11_11028 [Thelohanellus kitauei]